MKTLERFWQWFDNESPTAEHAQELAHQNLSPLAYECLNEAAGMVIKRSGLGVLWTDNVGALRDLSLALCAALERMHEQVPEAPPKSLTPFADEYLARRYHTDSAASAQLQAYADKLGERTRDAILRADMCERQEAAAKEAHVLTFIPQAYCSPKSERVSQVRGLITAGHYAKLVDQF